MSGNDLKNIYHVAGFELNTPEENERFKDKPKSHNYHYGFGPYNVVIGERINTCLKCDKEFTVKVRENDEAKFIRFCGTCRSTVRSGNYDIDFTESVGD